MANLLDEAASAKLRSDYLKGANPEQKVAINYFLPAKGCFGSKRPKDDEFKAAFNAIKKRINSYQTALNKIGIDESELKEIPPVTFSGYDEDASELATTTSSGEYVSNRYSITHLFFSSTQVYMYQVIFNLCNNEKKERTEEYFYKDITNFSTSTETTEAITYSGCLMKPTKVNVQVQKFSLIVPGDKFSCSTYGDIEPQVKAMKNKLREKKG